MLLAGYHPLVFFRTRPGGQVGVFFNLAPARTKSIFIQYLGSGLPRHLQLEAEPVLLYCGSSRQCGRQ
jgi:hypothetical protein